MVFMGHVYYVNNVLIQPTSLSQRLHAQLAGLLMVDLPSVSREHVSIFSRPPLLRHAQVACHITIVQHSAITSHVIRSLEKIFNGLDLNYC